jgi:hypothetical protein
VQGGQAGSGVGVPVGQLRIVGFEGAQAVSGSRRSRRIMVISARWAVARSSRVSRQDRTDKVPRFWFAVSIQGPGGPA